MGMISLCTYPANIDDNKFVLLRELMVHKKRQHEERINICWNYASGKCDFGSENCWFLHTERSETIFECNTCEKTFENQDKFLHHRKKYHKESVQTCKNVVSGKCIYGNGKCWFNHGDAKDSIGDEKDKKIEEQVIEKLFRMMEKFTEQMVEMKEMNNLK